MASVLMHAMVGVFVGLAAGVRLRWWPALAVGAEWIDLDHLYVGLLDGPSPVWMLQRGTFHNVFVASVIPAFLAAYVAWNELGTPDLRRFVTALPALTTSHLVFDVVNVPSGDAGWVFAFYPLSLQRIGVSVAPLAGNPAFVGPEAVGLAVAFLLAMAAAILTRSVDRTEDVELQRARVGAFVGIFALLVPLALLVVGRPLG